MRSKRSAQSDSIGAYITQKSAGYGVGSIGAIWGNKTGTPPDQRPTVVGSSFKNLVERSEDEKSTELFASIDFIDGTPQFQLTSTTSNGLFCSLGGS